MSTLSAAQPSRNPFRSNPSTPNVTGASARSASNNDNAPSLSGASGTGSTAPPPPSSRAPAVTITPPPPSSSRERDLEVMSALEEPPPYTPSPSVAEGEMTVEQGPARPFQPPPPRPSPSPLQNGWSPVQNQAMHTGSSMTPTLSPSSPSRVGGGRTGSLFRQLTNSLNEVVNNLNNAGSYNSGVNTHPTGQSTWSGYPGQQQPRPSPLQYDFTPPPVPPPRPPHANSSAHPHLVPPPRHPSVSASASSSHLPPTSASSSNPRRHSSEFARDFYAAGAGQGSGMPGEYAPSPPSPSVPSRTAASSSNSNNSIPNDGRPTSHPVAGHPLLKDGKVLVYPKGHDCDKCHNVGYKNGDPLRPCKRCWKKFAKPFSGPLAYSFSPSSATSDTNFQRPLPNVPPSAPPPRPPAVSLPPPAAHFAPGGYMSNNSGGFRSPPLGLRSNTARPPPGAVVYTAGDPRIGGRLCWRCDGKGNVSFFLLDRTTCDVCGGIGRTFN